jgi:dipeptidyl aminopeptidase/acylaminoacyl peptidase
MKTPIKFYPAALPILLIIICLSFHSCSHTVEEFRFFSGDFEVSAELRIPDGDQKFPLVIFVHGDGPAYKSYFETLKLTCLETGYATLMYDKPGFGKSKGKFSREHLREERADILVDAIKEMKKHPKIDGNNIGVWGISQAGYVIPMALSKTDEIKFMILVGVAGENGIRQTAYFVSKQIQCEGFTEEQAEEARQLAADVMMAKTYEEYMASGTVLLDKYPIVKALDFMAGILPEDRWKPKDPEGEAYYNPIDVIQATRIPTLVVLGDKDCNVDPEQSIIAYEEALTQARNSHFEVALIPGTDHNIILCETGCEKERRNRSGKEWSNYAPEYLELMKQFLTGIK